MATYQQWSQSYFDNLTPEGQLYVPLIDKTFNRLGEEVNKEDEQSYLDSLLTTGYNE